MQDPRHRLAPNELAEAAIMADLCVVAVVLARLSPFAGLTTVVGAIPFVVLGMRHRARAVVVAFCVAVVLVFLLAGFGAATQVLVMATFGGVIGRSFEHSWSRSRTIAVTIALGWSLVAALTIGFLWVFAGLRELNLEAARVQWTGIARGLDAVGLDVIVSFVDPRIDWILDNWFISVPIFQLVISVFLTLFVIRIGQPVVTRVQRAFGDLPAPSPEIEALAGELLVDGRREPSGTMTVVSGENGAGKTTLLRAIRAMQPECAVVGQRPESQVIGIRVDDDLDWGLSPPATAVQRAEALRAVGLDGFERRETSSLSGGELQRLALASAMIRQPSLLLSDESTAMIDPGGRTIVLAILRRLADEGVDVIHVSHLENEHQLADRIVEL